MASTNLQLMPRINGLVKPKRKALWLKNSKCHWCGQETRLVNDNAWDRATLDHVIPRYKGGTNDPSNIVLACNRCNNRRCYEDTTGLKEGSLLGQYKETQSSSERKAERRAALNRVVLTGDEKRIIMGKKIAEDVLREQRDQAQKEISNLRKELKHYEAVVKDQELQLKYMTIWSLIRKRLSEWMAP